MERFEQDPIAMLQARTVKDHLKWLLPKQVEVAPTDGRPIEAATRRGLTAAESMQLGMDALESAEVFEQVQIFAGKYHDERRGLSDKMLEYAQAVSSQEKENEDYAKIWGAQPDLISLPGHTPASITTVAKAALAAAGARMREVNHSVRDRADVLQAEQARFACLLAEFCQERLDGQTLIMNGMRFYYSLGFIWREEAGQTLTDENTKKLITIPKQVVYGDTGHLLACKRHQESKVPVKHHKQLKINYAAQKDWSHLLYSLEIISRF